jgi:adenylosuccinate synthase
MLYTIVGGQLGSEGKGELVSFIARHNKIDFAVRIGGPNAGHTFYDEDGQKVVVQSVPTPAMLQKACVGVVGPEGIILIDQLLKELREKLTRTGRPAQLLIDGNVAVIRPEHMAIERTDLTTRIGSTGEGVGACQAEKIMRNPNTILRNCNGIPVEEATHGVVIEKDTPILMNDALLDGKTVLIEGTQGFGLGLNTGNFYPYCTSRDCTPQALWSGTGINPFNALVRETVMVIRTFPIRVGGTSGPLEGEISWEQLKEETEGYVNTPEQTTVTKKIRRIARLDIPAVDRAIAVCAPDSLALTFLDYVFPETAGIMPFKDEHFDYIKKLQNTLGVEIKYVSTGPNSTYLTKWLGSK